MKRVVINSNLFQFLVAKDSPEKISIQQDEYNQLIQNVVRLPLKYKEVIHLYYYENLSVQEISELLAINQNTIKTRLKKGRELLATTLERGDFGGR